MSKLAVILLNMGGPDSFGAIKPFLFNLFNDPAIINVPAPIRYLLARFIAWYRFPKAYQIYNHIGGKSPIVNMTNEQAKALEKKLNTIDGTEARCFISMRYWHPRSFDTIIEVESFAPDKIILLPLYPQFSTVTSESSVKDWLRRQRTKKINVPTRTICCYPLNEGWLDAVAELTQKCIEKAQTFAMPRILFSAHSLPERVIKKGDPYQWQIECTAKALATRIDINTLDWVICYQSRVGLLKWIGPSIEDELIRAAADNVSVVIVPISFVSEHSETLVELDIKYCQKAKKLGIAGYVRVPTVKTHEKFINGLFDIISVAQNHNNTTGWISTCTAETCLARHGCCPHKRSGGQELNSYVY